MSEPTQSAAPARTARRDGPERLGAFSDGLIAVIITIMALELKAPDQPTFAAFSGSGPRRSATPSAISSSRSSGSTTTT